MAALRDVAQKAGVSICTASRVLGGRAIEGRISPSCARRVLKAAEELGYKPNYHARSLRRGRAHTLGLLLERPRGAEDAFKFWGQMIAGVDIETRLRGYDFLIIGAGLGEPVANVALRYLKEKRVDCLVVPGYLHFARTTPGLHARGVKAVLVEYPGKTRLPVVELDDASGIARAVRRLGELGHSKLLWLGPRSGWHPSIERRRHAFFKTARELGLVAKECLAAAECSSPVWDPGVEGAYKALLGELQKGEPPHAIVCYNESMAFGAYAALAERNLRIPEDVSVVGFDDIHASIACPPMTVVSHMLHELGRRAAALAIEMASVGEEDLRTNRVRVKAELIERASTAPRIDRRKG